MDFRKCSSCKHVLSDRDVVAYGYRCEDCWTMSRWCGMPAPRYASQPDAIAKRISNQDPAPGRALPNLSLEQDW